MDGGFFYFDREWDKNLKIGMRVKLVAICGSKNLEAFVIFWTVW